MPESSKMSTVHPLSKMFKEWSLNLSSTPRLLIREDFLRDDLRVCSTFRDSQALLNKIHDSPKIFKSMMLGIWGTWSSLSFWVESRKMCRYEATMIIKKWQDLRIWFKRIGGDARRVFYMCIFLRRRHWWRKHFLHVPRIQLRNFYIHLSWPLSRMRKAHVVILLY